MCESKNSPLEQSVLALVSEHKTGQVSRRDFLKRAVVLLGGAAAADGLWLAANNAPIPQVAAAMGIIDQAALPTPTPLPESAVDSAVVSFAAYGSDASGYVARPKGVGVFPAVVVIQEWWGLDDHIKSVARRFAEAGFVAVAPDLYRGQVAKEPNDAQRLVMAVQMPQALRDIQSAVNYITAQPYAAPKVAGVVGFCFGGGLAMQMAYQGQNVGAVATFYGASVSPSDADLKQVRVPIIGFYGGDDHSIPADRIAHWYDTLIADGKIAESHTYAGAPHAFFNDTRTSYNAAAAQDSWSRVQNWFHHYLIASESF
jgi:carboxymethylenebutenolidase